jgi:hypothetical protein
VLGSRVMETTFPVTAARAPWWRFDAIEGMTIALSTVAGGKSIADIASYSSCELKSWSIRREIGNGDGKMERDEFIWPEDHRHGRRSKGLSKFIHAQRLLGPV